MATETIPLVDCGPGCHWETNHGELAQSPYSEAAQPHKMGASCQDGGLTLSEQNSLSIGYLISIYQLLCHTIVYDESCLCNAALRTDRGEGWLPPP